MSKAFIPYELKHDQSIGLSDNEFSNVLRTWCGDVTRLPPTGTHFGYVYSGTLSLDTPAGIFRLSRGMYFSLPFGGILMANGQGIVITRLDYCGTFMLGGPIEPTGRLRYINGCTDSLLIPPVMRGDPCLNALYFPHDTDQTMHFHDSLRIGIVASGSGECETPEGVYVLSAGLAFVIPANSLHRFRTNEQTMIIIAYHPTSTTGPTDQMHPMILNTIVDGISASLLPELQTT